MYAPYRLQPLTGPGQGLIYRYEIVNTWFHRGDVDDRACIGSYPDMARSHIVCDHQS